MKRKNSKTTNFSEVAFTLTELIVAVAILGILSAIAIPNYMNSLRSSQQKEAELVVSILLTAVMSFTDENGRMPKGWDDLNYTQTLKTANGIASGTEYSQVELPSKAYEITGSIDDNTIIFEANPTNDNSDNWNVVACVNTTNGLSAVQKGPLKEDDKPDAKESIDAKNDCPSTP